MPKITQPALYLLPPQNIYLYNYNISMISPFGGIIIYNKLFHLSTPSQLFYKTLYIFITFSHVKLYKIL